MEKRQNGRFLVQFVDYGDFKKVDKWNLFPVQQQFSDFPEMAVQCCMLTPSGDAEWVKNINWEERMPDWTFDVTFLEKNINVKTNKTNKTNHFLA